MKALQRLTLAAMVVCLCVEPASGAQQPLGSRLTDDDGHWALVEAIVTSVGVPARPGDVVKAKLKVTRIYTGPKDLHGLAFPEATASEIVLTNTGDIVIPLLKVDETGLWVMATDMNGKWYASDHIRKGDTKYFDRRLKWADEVARLAKMNIAERLHAAKELCESEWPELSGLGIDVLFGASDSDAEKSGVEEFIKKLPFNPAVTLATLLRADLMLNQDARKKWTESPDRKWYLERFAGIVDEGKDVARSLIYHLASFPDGYRRIGAIAANSKQPLTVRMMALDRLGKAVQLSAKYDPAFDVLADVFKSEPEKLLRLLIAQSLAPLPRQYGKPFSPAQLEVLRDLLKNERDVDVASALSKALAVKK